MSPITFTNLFIRHNLKPWNWVEVLSKLMLPLAVFVLSHPPPPSSQCSGLVRPLPPSRRPEHQGIMGCRAEVQRIAAVSHPGERKQRRPVRRTEQETDSLQRCELKHWKHSSGSFFHIKTRAHPTALDTKTFSIHPVWVHENQLSWSLLLFYLC